MAATDGKPWDKRPSETDLSHDAFLVYLHQGVSRSLARVVVELGRDDHYVRQLKRWSSEHEWVSRCAAYDEATWAARKDGRDEARDRARQSLVDAAGAAADTVRELMEDTGTPPSVRLACAREILSLAGLVAPKRVELSGPDGKDIRVTARRALTGLDTDQLRLVAQALGVELEPEAASEEDA